VARRAATTDWLTAAPVPVYADGFGGDGVEFAAAVIAGAQPKDQLMAMQAAQMAG
jgi:hypothetical protein